MGQQNPKYQTMLQRLGFNDADLKTPGHDRILFWLKEHLKEILHTFYSLPAWDSALISVLRGKANVMVQERVDELTSRANELRRRADQAVHTGHEFDQKRAGGLRKEAVTAEDELTSLKNWAGLGDPPQPKIELPISPSDEHPIMTGDRSRVIVGYADLLVKCCFPKTLHLSGGRRSTTTYYCSDPEWSAPQWGVNYEEHLLLFEVKTSIPSYGELMRQLKTYKGYIGAEQVVVSPDDRFAAAINEQGVRFVKFDGELGQPLAVQGSLL